MFRRKAAEASAEEATGTTLTAEPEAGDSPDTSAEAPAAEAREASEGTRESGAEEPAEAAAEGVEIPKQQSAEAAADNEAGEGARK
ncbi:gliding motility protein [Streptomyces sp. NPDC056670]|uniref:gliding motility protein n=1 Tax=unclassified Streptomyces TaxID=2593676 RepID=UPI00368496DB